MGIEVVWNGPDMVSVEMAEACFEKVMKQRSVQVL